MRRSAFDENRDQRAADESGHDRSMMCGAYGCPNRWSVDPPWMCSAHAWAEAHRWPQITQEQLDAETQRLLDRAHPKPAQPFIKPDPVKLRRYFYQLAQGIRDRQQSPRAWADLLREREQAGERLTMAQREAWRSVRHEVGETT